MTGYRPVIGDYVAAIIQYLDEVQEEYEKGN